MRKIMITAVVPVYNLKQFLPRCIDTLDADNV